MPFTEEEVHEEAGGLGGLDTQTRIFYAFITAFLVIVAGLASGLTLGLLSLDKLELQVLIRSGT